MYIHAKEDVPFINSDIDLRKDVMLGESYNVTFTVSNITHKKRTVADKLTLNSNVCRSPKSKTTKM